MREFLARRGWVWQSVAVQQIAAMQRGDVRRLILLENLPLLTQPGRLLVKTSRKHVTAIIDGVVRDAVDPRGGVIWGWYEESA
jgi:hypothetical protein